MHNPKKINTLLSRSNVEIFKGDLKNRDSLNNIFNNTYVLFFALPLSKDSIGYGKTLLHVAKESNLEHIIYSSVDGLYGYLKVDHFRYKKEIEDYLQNLDKPYTIIHPAGYMDEFAHPKSIKFITGLLKLCLPESKTFQLIALKDIGAFTKLVFDNPSKYRFTEFEIAGDELSLNELFEKIEKIKNIKMTPMKIPGFVKFILPKIMKQMLEFYAGDGWNAHLKLLRKENPELLSFEDWLRATDIYDRYYT